MFANGLQGAGRQRGKQGGEMELLAAHPAPKLFYGQNPLPPPRRDGAAEEVCVPPASPQTRIHTPHKEILARGCFLPLRHAAIWLFPLMPRWVRCFSFEASSGLEHQTTSWGHVLPPGAGGFSGGVHPIFLVP